MARGRKRRGVRHLAARDEGEGRRGRNAQHLLRPIAADLLDDRLRRRGQVGRCILIPGRCEPVRRQRNRKRTADHPAEETSAGRAQDAAFGIADEVVDDLLG